MDKVTFRVVSALKDKLTELAEAGMRMPQEAPFGHGVQVGKYQGVLMALDTIDGIVNEEDSNE